MDLLTYLHHSWPMLLRLTGEHLALVGSAVGLAIVIGVPLGILITRHRFLATPLLALAKKKGIATISGVEMFVQQGARQFEIWTGKPAPEAEMQRVVEHELRRRASQPS